MKCSCVRLEQEIVTYSSFQPRLLGLGSSPFHHPLLRVKACVANIPKLWEAAQLPAHHPRFIILGMTPPWGFRLDLILPSFCLWLSPSSLCNVQQDSMLLQSLGQLLQVLEYKLSNSVNVWPWPPPLLGSDECRYVMVAGHFVHTERHSRNLLVYL
jgi:hypothetical protein